MSMPFATTRNPTWDELRVVLQLVSHSYVTWRVRQPVVGRRVDGAAWRVRLLRMSTQERMAR